jgi:hypothetical protein
VPDVEYLSVPPRLADTDFHRLDREIPTGTLPIIVSMRGVQAATAYGMVGLRLRIDAIRAAGRPVSVLMPTDVRVGTRLASSGLFNDLSIDIEGDRAGHPTAEWNGVPISRLLSVDDVFGFAEKVALTPGSPNVAQTLNLAAFIAGLNAQKHGRGPVAPLAIFEASEAGVFELVIADRGPCLRGTRPAGEIQTDVQALERAVGLSGDPFGKGLPKVRELAERLGADLVIRSGWNGLVLAPTPTTEEMPCPVHGTFVAIRNR